MDEQKAAQIRAEVKAILAKELKEKQWSQLNDKANDGDAEAQFELADCFFNGKEIARNYLKAIEWYTRAAELGHLESQKKLYDCYINGKGVDKDANEAVKWLTMAADAGDALSQSDLANKYANGIDVEKNLEKAYIYYKLSAEQGCWISIANLGGWCYLWGNGVEKNYEQAIFWLERALREYGMNDSQSVCEWARKAYAVALSNYGWEKEHNNPDDATLKEIFEMYKKSADLENTFGISNLGHCYQYGIGTDIDLYKADQLYLQAKSRGHSTDVFEKWFAELEKTIFDQSDSGDIRSQALRGSWFLNGTHGEKNEDKALYYLSLAADQGNDFAQNQFAHYYLLKEDYERAYMLFKKSAFTNGDSMRCLGGICYLEGKGVKKDFTMAEYWLSMAKDFVENDKEWTMSKLDNAKQNKYNCNNTDVSIDNIPEGNRNLFNNSMSVEIGTFSM